MVVAFTAATVTEMMGRNIKNVPSQRSRDSASEWQITSKSHDKYNVNIA
jgi:hypothetical protein